MKKELCEHCGASMMMNCVTMSSHMLGSLTKAAQHSEPFQTRDLRLTKTEYTTVTKLKYWGFIKRVGKKHWQITPAALAFLRGEKAVPGKLWYFRDRVIKVDADISVHDVLTDDESRQKYIDLIRPVIGEFQTNLCFF